MEDTETAATSRNTGKDGNQEADNMVLMSGKPLHRFVQKEPRSLGIVILIFGCAELLMGFHLPGIDLVTSYKIYIPFWQGVLFLVCGILSIYTELHPSKKMVTVCLSMYAVSVLGIIVSIAYRIHCFTYISHAIHYGWYVDTDSDYHQLLQVMVVEGILFTSSLCVSVLLIFLCVVARFALKSTHTQIIVHHIAAPQRETTPE